MRVVGFFGKLLSVAPSRWHYWLAWAVAMRICWWGVLYHTLEIGKEPGSLIGIFYRDGDSAHYLELAEHFVQTGTYADNNQSHNSFAARMPGLAAPYILFRLFLPQTGAINAVFVLQMALSVLSLYAVGWWAYCITQSQVAFVAAFFLYGLSAYAPAFDVVFLTESLTNACLILAGALCAEAAALYETKLKRKTWLLLGAGFFCTWAFFLRPATAPFMLCLTVLVWLGNKDGTRKFLRWVLILLIPLAIAEGWWLVRNYQIYHKPVQLTSSFYDGTEVSPGYGALLTFVRTWGGSTTYWYPDAEIRFFLTADLNYPQPDSLPPYALAPGYNLDSLRVLRRYSSLILSQGVDKATLAHADSITRQLSTRYRILYQQQRPLQVGLMAPLRLAKKLLIQNGTYYISKHSFADATIVVKLFKEQQAVIHVLHLTATLLAAFLVMSLPPPERLHVLMTLLFIVSQVAIHCWVFRHIEYRYILACLPCMAVLVGILAAKFGPQVLRRFRMFVVTTNQDNP